MKRSTLATWLVASVIGASCAQGSNLGGVGGGGLLGTGGSQSTASSGGTGATGTTSTGGSGGPGAIGTGTGLGGSGGIPGSGGVAPGSTSSTGGSGGTGGTGGSIGTDAGSPTGWGACVTQQDVDDQSSLPFEIGFCVGNFFGCAFACPDDCVMEGDTCCSPACTCAMLPPICGPADAGTDAPDDGSAVDDAGAADAAAPDADASVPDAGAQDASVADAAADSPSDGPGIITADAAP